MLNPAIGKLLRTYNSRYQLVLDVAKTARIIAQKAEDDETVLEEKPVNAALNLLCEYKCAE